MQFPNYVGFRYPSQLLEGALDLAVLPLLFVIARTRPRDGVVAWTWFAFYGVARSIDEVWRVTDIQVGPLTGAQLLSLPMIVIGIFMTVRALRYGSPRVDVASSKT